MTFVPVSVTSFSSASRSFCAGNFTLFNFPAILYLFPVTEFVGTYELAPGVQMRITSEDEKLYSQRENRPKVQLIPEATEIFFAKGIEGRKLFRRGSDGKVDALIDRRNNEDVIWKKVK